jgi:hypothetical protein
MMHLGYVTMAKATEKLKASFTVLKCCIYLILLCGNISQGLLSLTT